MAEMMGQQGGEGPGRTPATQVIRVDAGEVLSSVGGAKDESAVKLGTFTQRAGLRLAAGVGSLGVLVTVGIVVNTMWKLPAAPQLTAGMTPAQVEALVAAQKQISDVVVTTGMTLFDSVVVKVLLPVFTSILGYIFGARSEAAAQQRP